VYIIAIAFAFAIIVSDVKKGYNLWILKEKFCS
jgi:hypothetical protein